MVDGGLHPILQRLEDRIKALRAAGNAAEALNTARTLQSETLRLVGADSIAYAYALQIIGVAAMEAGLTDESIKIDMQALALWEEKQGKEGSNVAQTLNNLAETLNRAGRLPEAERLYRRALALHQKASHEYDSAETMIGLSSVLRDEKKFKEAHGSLNDALKILKRIDGGSSERIALTLHNLGDLSFFQDQRSDALALLGEAISMQEKVLPPNHPDLANTLKSLGNVLFAEQNYSAALSAYSRALNISENALGSYHPNTLSLLDLVGRALFFKAYASAQRKDKSDIIELLQSYVAKRREASKATALYISNDPVDGDARSRTVFLRHLAALHLGNDASVRCCKRHRSGKLRGRAA